VRKTAIILDAPIAGRGPFDGYPGEILAETIRTIMLSLRHTPPKNLLDEVSIHYVVTEPTPGGKPPKLAEIRARRETLMSEIDAAQPRAVLSVGVAGLTALSGAKRAAPITKWRGQTRWLELPSGRRVAWTPTISAGAVAAQNEKYRDLAFDVWKAWSQDAPKEPPVVETFVPYTFDDLRASLAAIEDATVVSCDVETTSLRAFSGSLLSVGFGASLGGNEAIAVIVPREILGDSRVQELCWNRIFRKSSRTVFHNGQFDLQFLTNWLDCDIPREAFLGDTLLLGYLLDERASNGATTPTRVRGLGLKDFAATRYDLDDYHWDWNSFYADIAHDEGRCEAKCKHSHPDKTIRTDWDGLYHYHALDVANTARLWFDLLAEAKAESPKLMEAHDKVLIPAMKTLAQCQRNGAPLDLEWFALFTARLERRLARRERVLMATVVALGAPETDFNMGSASQVADLMYDTWQMTPDVRKKHKKTLSDGPDRSTDKEHIKAAIIKYKKSPDKRLALASKWLHSLLAWRTDTKQLSTYSSSIVNRADADGRVRAQFFIHGTVTGRLSSGEPNLQNVPAVDDKKVVNGRTSYTIRGGNTTFWPARRGFAPRPGNLIIEADYSQLELRVAAWLSGDVKLRDVFVNKRDIHREVAATMFSRAPEKITKPERYLAKAVDFGILYGRTAKAISMGVEMDMYEREMGGKRWDEATAEAFIQKFLRGYPQLGRWLNDNAAGALANYYVESPFGRRRRFPFRPRDKWSRLAIERQANNTPIQSAASDICLQAMWNIAPRLPEGAMMLFPVHDSIVLEIEDSQVDEVSKILREEMEQFVGEVPLTIDIEVGTSWADVH
jgi:DNA polymerase I-like protein with 3'-5' exonuclease and polymerase domains